MYSRSVILCALLGCAASRTTDSAEGVRVTTYDAHWHTSKLEDALAAVVDDFLPAPLLDRMHAEALLFERSMASTAVRSGRHGFWLDLDRSTGRKVGGARIAIEHAIEQMLRLDFPDEAERAAIAGAEWWLQLRTADGEVGFHYDKDEGLAGQGRLRCPHESTITYLTSGASPTVIVNRTTPDGNGCDPLRPLNAVLTYPRAGRHVIFRGNLVHGVLSALSAGRLPAGQQPQPPRAGPDRITLLANWWPKKPLHPNCQLLSDERLDGVLASAGLRRYEPSMGVATMGTSRPLKRVHFTAAAAAAAAAAAGGEGGGGEAAAAGEAAGGQRGGKVPVAHYEAMLRFADHMVFELPADLDRAALEAWDVRWAPEQVQAQFGHLDFGHKLLMEYMFDSDEPKVLVFSPWAAEGGAALQRVKRVLLPSARALTGAGKVMFADSLKHEDALENFGSVTAEQRSALADEGAPIVVYHDATRSRHAVMAEPFSGASVARFIDRVVAGKAATVPDLEEEEEL